jgi:hypothetical protein
LHNPRQVQVLLLSLAFFPTACQCKYTLTFNLYLLFFSLSLSLTLSLCSIIFLCFSQLRFNDNFAFLTITFCMKLAATSKEALNSLSYYLYPSSLSLSLFMSVFCLFVCHFASLSLHSFSFSTSLFLSLLLWHSSMSICLYLSAT